MQLSSSRLQREVLLPNNNTRLQNLGLLRVGYISTVVNYRGIGLITRFRHVTMPWRVLCVPVSLYAAWQRRNETRRLQSVTLSYTHLQ